MEHLVYAIFNVFSCAAAALAAIYISVPYSLSKRPDLLSLHHASLYHLLL